MTLHLDRWSVQTPRDATAAFIEPGADARTMLEIFYDEWLATAEPLPGD
jgi:hypothetical protein